MIRAGDFDDNCGSFPPFQPDQYEGVEDDYFEQQQKEEALKKKQLAKNAGGIYGNPPVRKMDPKDRIF